MTKKHRNTLISLSKDKNELRRPVTLLLTDGTSVHCQAVTYLKIERRSNAPSLDTLIVWNTDGQKLTYEGSEIVDVRIDGPLQDFRLN